MIVRARGMGVALTPTQQQIVTAAQNAGIDPALALAVAQQESGFNPSAVSSAGATGLFQLMPATAASVGVTNSNDPTQNIQGGLTYLSQLLQKYGGDVSSALWAYNAGPGNEAAGVLPAETASYIPSVEALQSTWAAQLGLPSGTASSSVPSSADDSSDDSGDNTLLYVGVGLGAAALLWALLG